jgi:hypothetical protein
MQHATRGSRRRDLAFLEVSWVVKMRSSSSSTNQTGTTCGRPSAATVASLAVRVPWLRKARTWSGPMLTTGSVSRSPTVQERARPRDRGSTSKPAGARTETRVCCAGQSSDAFHRYSEPPGEAARPVGKASGAARRGASRRQRLTRQAVAEGVGFEPTVSCPTHALQACRFVRSRTPPGGRNATHRG